MPRKIRTTPGKKPYFNWTTIVQNSPLLSLFGSSGSYFRFKVGTSYHIIYLNGVNIGKDSIEDRLDHARCMRERDNHFFVLTDLSVHGVNKKARKKGGYYLHDFSPVLENGACTGKYKANRLYIPLKATSKLGIERLPFKDKFWRITDYFYYGVDYQGVEDGNTS